MLKAIVQYNSRPVKVKELKFAMLSRKTADDYLDRTFFNSSKLETYQRGFSSIESFLEMDEASDFRLEFFYD